MKKPYVGVTGLVNNLEVELVTGLFEGLGFNMQSEHIPMLGFLMSHRTLHDEPPRELKTPNVKYLNWRTLRRRMQESRGKALNMIHYATKTPEILFEDVDRMFSGLYDKDNIYETGLCRAIQLNVVWPEVSAIERLKTKFSDLSVVLQLSKSAMGETDPENIASRVRDYDNLIDYALIDPSGGRGIDFDLENSKAVYEAICSKSHKVRIGFAGGLSGRNSYHKIKSLCKAIGNTSICVDAEGGLRDKTELTDDLNYKEVEKYLTGVKQAFDSFKEI